MSDTPNDPVAWLRRCADYHARNGYSMDGYSSRESVATFLAIAARLDAAERERDEARTYGERLYRECAGSARSVACAWCGHQYATGTPRSQNETLVQHAKVCEKHPLRQAEAERDTAQAEVARLRAALARTREIMEQTARGLRLGDEAGRDHAIRELEAYLDA